MNKLLYSSAYYNDLKEVLYFEQGDGEISIYCEEENSPRLMMLIVIDITSLFKEKRGKAFELIQSYACIKDDCVVSIYRWWHIKDELIFIETEAPSMFYNEGIKELQISWKNYCKKKFTNTQIKDVVRSIAQALRAIHKQGMIHRDVHPTRVQEYPIWQNG